MVSIHCEGVADQILVADRGDRGVNPGRGDRASVPTVRVIRVSPMMFSSATGVPNTWKATSATTAPPPLVPSVDMVAEVPMHCTLSASQASLTRLMSSATSAPWRPR